MRYERSNEKMEHEVVRKMNDTSCFENWIALKKMWGFTLDNYKNTMTKNALMTILGKTGASMSFWFMRYERSNEKMEQEMVSKINDTSCFENWISLKRMWGRTLTGYNNMLMKNALMTIMGKTRASKSFWFMIYERSSDQMEQEMVINMNDTSCFENWIALKQMWGITLTNYRSLLTKNALMTILGKTRASKSF